MAGKGSVRLGYAANEDGHGVVYARIRQGDAVRVVRAYFTLAVTARQDPFALGFAAVKAVAPAVRKRLSAVDLHLQDDSLAAALTGLTALPEQMFLPYVQTRCALNAFARCTVLHGEGERDLTARALAEVSLHVAA